jgi:cysteine sulfinate desulfinase/cysteine desulfurase-like protein
MGFSESRARASLRFSFSRFNTEAEVIRTVDLLMQWWRNCVAWR